MLTFFYEDSRHLFYIHSIVVGMCCLKRLSLKNGQKTMNKLIASALETSKNIFQNTKTMRRHAFIKFEVLTLLKLEIY